MNKRISFKLFLKKYDISFTSDFKAIGWLKRLKPKHCAKVGNTFFVNEDEIVKLMQLYWRKQDLSRQKRSKQMRLIRLGLLKEKQLAGENSNNKPNTEAKAVNPVKITGGTIDSEIEIDTKASSRLFSKE